MNWIMSNGQISHFPWQTHRTVSAPFTESHSRSALFNIFRAAALTERRGRGKKKKKHCCYGDEERVSGGWGAPWQKTRPDPTTPAPIGPELNADVVWQQGVLETTLKRTRDSYLKLFTLILSGSAQCPLHQQGFTHLDISDAGYRCRVIWQPAPKIQWRQLLQIFRTAFSALRCIDVLHRETTALIWTYICRDFMPIDFRWTVYRSSKWQHWSFWPAFENNL